MSLYLKAITSGYPFIIDRGRNPIYRGASSSEPEDVEMEPESSTDDIDMESVRSDTSSLSSRATVFDRRGFLQLEAAVQGQLAMLPPVPSLNQQGIAPARVLTTVPQALSMPFSPSDSVAVAHDEEPLIMPSPVSTGKPLVQIGAQRHIDYKYTLQFIQTLVGSYVAYYINRSKTEGEILSINYDKQRARVKFPAKILEIDLCKLKRRDWPHNQQLLVRQSDGHYALGEIVLLKGNSKEIKWVGTNQQTQFRTEGDQILVRYIPVEGNTLRHFTKVEAAYQAARDSAQLIPAYKLNL